MHSVRSFWGLLAFSLAACGGNVVFVSDGAGGAGGGNVTPTTDDSTSTVQSVTTGPDACESVITDFDAPTGYCTGPSLCDLFGVLANGSTVQEHCEIGEIASCTLIIDGAEQCACPADRIDWTNNCPNGVPTCEGWQFNWGSAASCLPE